VFSERSEHNSQPLWYQSFIHHHLLLILAEGRKAQSGYLVTRRWAFCPSPIPRPPPRKLRVYYFLYYFSYVCLCVFLKIVTLFLPSTHTSVFHAVLHKTIVVTGQGLITTTPYPPTILSPIFDHVKLLALYVTIFHHVWKLSRRVLRKTSPPNMARYVSFSFLVTLIKTVSCHRPLLLLLCWYAV